jgi:hypothetical protein
MSLNGPSRQLLRREGMSAIEARADLTLPSNAPCQALSYWAHPMRVKEPRTAFAPGASGTQHRKRRTNKLRYFCRRDWHIRLLRSPIIPEV